MMTPEQELLVRLAVLIKAADPTGAAAKTPTFQKLSIGLVEVLMDPANHAKYLKISKEVEMELSALQPRATNVKELQAA